MASTALRPVMSVPPIAPSTRVVLEALGMTSKVPSAAHHTIRSSSTEPSSSSRGCTALCRGDLTEVVGERPLERRLGVRSH